LEKCKTKSGVLKLAELENKDPGLFWKSVRLILKKRSENRPNIASEMWVDYFKGLLNISSTRNPFLDYVYNSLPNIENTTSGNLDYEISFDEVSKAINKAKKGKSTGPDMISNDMLKSGSIYLLYALQHLFNIILKQGIYPDKWKISLITPIYKSLDIDNPKNYRGVAVADCISKIFCNILNKRLVNYLTENGFWKINQNGFMEKRRTDDNVMVLHTLFQKYVKNQKGKLYTAFVDFSKFFDSIDRPSLFYKLQKANITGHFYNVLKTAYTDSSYSIKLDSGITESFLSTTGVKQGCTLSPTLSNIFQNDIHDIFDEECDPVILGNTKFNSISWADDLVLVSTSKCGLQNSLDKLGHYCEKWNLKLNVDKTKVMIMSKGYASLKNIKINGEALECVKFYKYLGVIISANGSTKKMEQDRIVKAKKAMYTIKKALGSTLNTAPQLSMSLFDKQVEPILTYGCTIWGPPSCSQSIKLFCNISDKRNMKNEIDMCFAALNIHDMEVVSYRYNCEKKYVYIVLKNVTDKSIIMQSYEKNPVNFVIEDCIKNEFRDVDKLHAKFVKSSLGVSKFCSNTMAFGELGRIPISYKCYTRSILYWLRMAKGSHNVLLDEAYITMTEENNSWLENIKYLLYMNGMGFIWEDPHAMSKEVVKSMCNVKFKDMYIQKYRAYLNEYENSNKCMISNICANMDECYGKKDYLNIVKSPEIRSIVSKYRLDVNNTCECKFRSFRFKNVINETCNYCNEKEDVLHNLFMCNKPNILSIRSQFYSDYSKYSPLFIEKSVMSKAKEILNITPDVEQLNKNKTIGLICKFIKNIYDACDNHVDKNVQTLVK
jgi:hypothetical protein